MRRTPPTRPGSAGDAAAPAARPATRHRRARALLYAGTAGLASLVLAEPAAAAISAAIDPPTAVVTGTVFEDRDGDGVFDDRDKPLEGVSVSDGTTIVTSGADGTYSLETSTERRKTDLVFVTQPAGYSVGADESMTAQFYRDLGELADGDAPTADFALTKDTDARGSNFTFGNVADPHVNADLSDQIAEINATAQDLAFIQVSGDLTNSATDGEFTRYKAATANSEVPVWPAVGNHEYSAGNAYADRIDNYRRHVGPEWYSFDYGDRHFIVLENNGAAPFEEQLAWAEADLAANVGDKKLVVLTHQPMNVPFGSSNVYDRYGELLESYGAELILVGHEHSNDVEPDSEFAGTAKHVQTSSSSYTIDHSPRGFRYVTMAGEKFENPFRMYGADQDLTITSPADGTAVPLDGFPGIQVNAYDTTDAPTEVRFRMDGGNWRPLKGTGEFTWHTPLQGNLRTVGEHTIEVRATDAAGRSWSDTATFTFTADDAIAPTAGEGWEQHHGDEGHTGVAGDEIPAGQRLAWSYRTEGTFLTGSPVIVDGVVYAGTRDENGDGNSAVHAVDQETGTALWTREVPSSVHGSIAVADGTVLVPTLRGTLFALDAATGEPVWQHEPGPAPEGYNQRTYGYYGVTVADDMVLYPYQTRHGEASSGLLVALDLGTGERVWAAPMTGATMSDGTPAVADGTVFVGNQTADRVLAYDLQTGERRWTGDAQLGGWQDGVPAAADGRVLIGSNNGIVARDAGTGETLWSYRSPHPSLVNGGATPAAPTIAGDVVYMGFPSGAVTALDAATGAVLWDRLLPGERYRGGVHTSPALSGTTLFVGSNNGTFYALDSRTGQPLWQHEIGTWVSAGPAVSGNTVVVGALDGNLYAYTPGGEAADPWPAVTGTVTTDGAPTEGITVNALRDGAVVATTTTGPDGTYRMGLEGGDGTYTLRVSSLGFASVAEEVAVSAGDSVTVDLALTPVTVDAAVGKRLEGGLVEGGLGDVVMENRQLALSIARETSDPQLGESTAGKVRDMAMTGRADQLDWINLPYVSSTEPTGGGAWSQLQVRSESVEIVEATAERAVVRATGGSAEHPGLRVVTTYTITPDEQWVTAETVFTNTTGEALRVWVGDGLDFDGTGQRSGVAGNPAITSGTGPYTPDEGRWIGQTGTDGSRQTYGLLYTPESGDFTAYASAAWNMSKFHVEISAGGSHTLERRVVVADNGGAGDPFAVLDAIAADAPFLTGTVTSDGGPAAAVTVQALRDGEPVAAATTGADGTYALPLTGGAGTYTLQASGLGFNTAEREVTVDGEAAPVADLTLAPVTVDAATGKRLAGSLAEGGPGDVVIENQHLAMTVAKDYQDSQLSPSTTGKPVDLALTGRDDQIDWLNLPYVTSGEPTSWPQRQVRSDSVQVVENSGERAVVEVTGTSSEHPGLEVVSTYTATPGDGWISARSVFTNHTGQALPVWVGDVVDFDGAGQHSAVAGNAPVTTGDVATYTPGPGRWIGQSGTDGSRQTYGLLYSEDSGDFTAHGSNIWMMSRFQVDIPAGGSHTLERRIVVADNGGASDSFAVLEEIAAR